MKPKVWLIEIAIGSIMLLVLALYIHADEPPPLPSGEQPPPAPASEKPKHAQIRGVWVGGDLQLVPVKRKPTPYDHLPIWQPERRRIVFLPKTEHRIEDKTGDYEARVKEDQLDIERVTTHYKEGRFGDIELSFLTPDTAGYQAAFKRFELENVSQPAGGARRQVIFWVEGTGGYFFPYYPGDERLFYYLRTGNTWNIYVDEKVNGPNNDGIHADGYRLKGVPRVLPDPLPDPDQTRRLEEAEGDGMSHEQIEVRLEALERRQLAILRRIHRLQVFGHSHPRQRHSQPERSLEDDIRLLERQLKGSLKP